MIDPRPLEPVAYGERGERVVTSFGRGAIPLIRYRTGDLVCKVPASSCSCGRGFDIYEGGILGRVDDMKLVRGTNVYPRAIEAIVREFPEVDEFQTVITREGIRDEITLRVEMQARLGHRPLGGAVGRRCTAAWPSPTRASTSASSGPAAGELPRFELKAKRTRRPALAAGRGEGVMASDRVDQVPLGIDLLGSPLSATEERLLAVYEELKALCAAEELPPNAAPTCGPRSR